MYLNVGAKPRKEFRFDSARIEDVPSNLRTTKERRSTCLVSETSDSVTFFLYPYAHRIFYRSSSSFITP